MSWIHSHRRRGRALSSPLDGEGEGDGRLRSRLVAGKRLAFALALLAVCTQPAAAGFDPFTVADVEDRLGAEVPLGGTLLDADGQTTTLRKLAGKPVLLAPVDYGCTNICGVTLRGLFQALDALALEPGREFAVVVLGIDPRDGASEAAAERAGLGAGAARDGIHFVTGETAPIAAAIGFRYAYDQETGQYAHAAAVAVLTPDGRLARWLYGYPFQPSDLRLALVEAADEGIGTLADRLWLLCYGYDPELGAYTAAVGTALRAGGGLTVLALGGFVLVMLRRELGSSSPARGSPGRAGSSGPEDDPAAPKPVVLGLGPSTQVVDGPRVEPEDDSRQRTASSTRPGRELGT